MASWNTRSPRRDGKVTRRRYLAELPRIQDHDEQDDQARQEHYFDDHPGRLAQPARHRRWHFGRHGRNGGVPHACSRRYLSHPRRATTVRAFTSSPRPARACTSATGSVTTSRTSSSSSAWAAGRFEVLGQERETTIRHERRVRMQVADQREPARPMARLLQQLAGCGSRGILAFLDEPGGELRRDLLHAVTVLADHEKARLSVGPAKNGDDVHPVPGGQDPELARPAIRGDPRRRRTGRKCRRRRSAAAKAPSTPGDRRCEASVGTIAEAGAGRLRLRPPGRLAVGGVPEVDSPRRIACRESECRQERRCRTPHRGSSTRHSVSRDSSH